MKAVLFFVVPTFRLTGSTINAIEYFLEGYDHNPDLMLYLINGTKAYRRKILKLIYDRYVMDGKLNALHNIKCISKYDIPSQNFDTVLVVDYVTIGEIKGIIRARKILVISEKYTELPQYFLSKSLYNVEYFGEMPFHYKDHEYRMKCLFSRYRKLGKVERGTYVNSPRNNDLDMDAIREKYIHLPAPFIFKSKTKPEENLFEKFTHYLYYHADTWFDPHPRLFLECRYYNKVITYVNPFRVKDGSWYRYDDLLNRGLYDRTLNVTDEIIRKLI